MNTQNHGVYNKVYTITYGDVAENHAKMQKIGTLHDNGYSILKLQNIQTKLNNLGLVTELVDLNVGFDEAFEQAKVLVIRRGAQFILGEETDALIAENDALTMDKKAFMKGKVVNKVARWNLCFAEEDQEPNYGDGKGRIVSWAKIPKMARIRQVISEWTEDVLLNGEANYYYDISKCGIGYHGDGERKKVFAVRMGETMPLYFQWFQRSLPVGTPFELVLNDGDMYIMSEKAVGFDWLKKITPTLRHSTGCKKFTGENGVVNTFKKGVAKNHAQLEADKAQKLAIIEADKAQKLAIIAAEKAQKLAIIAADKAAKKLQLETDKALKLAIIEAKKAAKTLQIEAKKAAKTLQIEAKKNNKKK